jgi:hypothetical protein
LDFAPFFADLVAFFFAAILLYIEKGVYISFLIIKIKKIDLDDKMLFSLIPF